MIVNVHTVKNFFLYPLYVYSDFRHNKVYDTDTYKDDMIKFTDSYTTKRERSAASFSYKTIIFHLSGLLLNARYF
jgi:hypothetical protein